MKHVLITGFAGTLGTAFTDHFLFHGWKVTGIDSNEWAVASFPDHDNLTKVLGDFSDVTGKYDLTVHCAAYKHVDLLEQNPAACYENNVLNLEYLYHNVEGPILFISTDKAVEPVSVYGRSKGYGEMATFKRGGVVARLGNIIGSNGSVIPKWEECLDHWQQLPITDPHMTRYLIEANKAVARIMALYVQANFGEVIIPEMGYPIALMDMVNRVVDRWEEKHPDEIRTRSTLFKTVGMRPGEKLHEKLKWDDEETILTNDDGIIVKGHDYENTGNRG